MEFNDFLRCFQFISVVNLLPEKMPSDLPQNVMQVHSPLCNCQERLDAN